jgi:hypothetical protein
LQDVLHLHGYFDYPPGILLTRDDYKKYYGPVKVKDELGQASDGVLDTLHRKVAWSLLTNYHVLFAGFSLSDPYFTEVLDIAKTDLDLGDRRAHTALVGLETQPGESAAERQERLTRKASGWVRWGIQPVFFEVRVNPATGNLDDHLSAQVELLEDTLMKLGIDVPGVRRRTWSDDMVARVSDEN